MFILFLSLILLTGCALIIGSALAGYLDAESSFDRREDLATISIWLGIVILANSFFAISLVSRLSLLITIGFTALAFSLALLRHNTRQFLIRLAKTSSFSTYCGIAVVFLGVAGYCSQVLVWYDSGLYHLQYIRWLSDVGIVPGIALIHWRLGISSSWFALTAPFNQGILAGRMFTMAGGFCLLMLLLQAGIALTHVIKRQRRRQDLFMLCATMLVIPVVLVWGMPNSPTPDLPVICLEIVTAWAILAISREPAATDRNSTRHVSMAVLILATGAASMKLSAAPLLAIAGLFYLFWHGISFAKLWVGVATIGLMLAPLTGAGILISGCAFFPSSLSTVDTPWALGRSVVEEKSKIIQDWAKWGGALPPADASSWNWLIPWIRAEKVGTALITLSLVSALIILFFRRQRDLPKGTFTVVAIGLAGTAFMLCTAPSWRFGLGYLVLIPAMTMTIFGKRAICSAFTSRATVMLRNPALFGVLVATAIALHSHLLPRPSYKLLDGYFSNNPEVGGDKPHFNILFPPRSQNICFEIDPATVTTTAMAHNTLIEERAVDFTYFRPASSETCWDSPLPCAVDTLDTVALRDRQRGIAGGFIRSDTIR